MKTIAIDFDGVIHKYSKGWQDGSIYDGEIEGSLFAIDRLLTHGYSVFIFSSRSPRQIRKWFNDKLDVDYPLTFGWGVCVIPFWKRFWNSKRFVGVTKRKLPAMCYIDDRAVKFNGDWAEILGQITSK